MRVASCVEGELGGRVMGIPYSGKLWRALNLANWSPEHIGEFKFGDIPVASACT